MPLPSRALDTAQICLDLWENPNCQMCENPASQMWDHPTCQIWKTLALNSPTWCIPPFRHGLHWKAVKGVPSRQELGEARRISNTFMLGQAQHISNVFKMGLSATY
eukprot:jgi/Botrbrau1/22530/Bobra.114_2s0054.1